MKKAGELIRSLSRGIAACAILASCCLAPVGESGHESGSDGGLNHEPKPWVGLPKGCVAPTARVDTGPPLVWARMMVSGSPRKLVVLLSSTDLSTYFVDSSPCDQPRGMPANIEGFLEIFNQSIAPGLYPVPIGSLAVPLNDDNPWVDFAFSRIDVQRDSILSSLDSMSAQAYSACGQVEIDGISSDEVFGSYAMVMSNTGDHTRFLLSGGFSAKSCAAAP